MFRNFFHRLSGPRETDNDISARFIAAAREALASQTAAHAATWHLGQEENWAANLDTGTLTLNFPNGITAVAPIQVVGTYDTAERTFLWGWDPPSVLELLRGHARLAKAWGAENHVIAFTARLVRCDEERAWGFAAVANRLGDSNGAYSGLAGVSRVFMTFGQVKLEQAAP